MQALSQRALLAIASAAALLAGCGTISTYSGKEPPEEEIAILEGYHRIYLIYGSFADITGVDGKRPEGLAGRAARARLSPGPHCVELIFDRALGHHTTFDQCAFREQFEKGHRYRIKSYRIASDSDATLELETVFGNSVARRSIPMTCGPAANRFCAKERPDEAR